MPGEVLGSAVLELKTTDAGLTRSMGQAKRSVMSDFNQMQQGANRLGSVLTKALSFGAVLVGLRKFSQGVSDTIKVFAGFEQAMANVQSVARGTPAEFERLTRKAMEMGRTTRFTASQAADALYYLASAGMDANESIASLNGVLNLAGATQSDLAFTSEAVAASLSQFNLQAHEAERVSNVFTAAIQNSMATMDKLATSMKTVGPVASGMGYSIEQLTGQLQVLYNAGLDASTAGTAMRNIFAQLANAASPAIAQLREMGVAYEEVNPETNDFADIVDRLNSIGITAGETMAVFGNRAGPAMIKLLDAGGDAIRDYTAAVTDTNAAAQAYAIQNDTLSGAFDRLKSAAESARITLGQRLAPVMRNITERFTDFINDFTLLVEHGALRDAAKIIVEGVWNAVKALFEPANFEGIVSSIGSLFIGVFQANIQTGFALFGHAANVLRSTADKLGEDWIKEIMNGIIRGVTAGPRWVLGLLGVEGAATWKPFETEGPALGQSLAQSFAEEIPAIIQTYKDFFAEVVEGAQGVGAAFSDAMSAPIDDMQERLETLMSRLRSLQDATTSSGGTGPGDSGGPAGTVFSRSAHVGWIGLFADAGNTARAMIESLGIDTMEELREFIARFNTVYDETFSGAKAGMNKPGKNVSSGALGGSSVAEGVATPGFVFSLDSFTEALGKGIGIFSDLFGSIENVAAVLDPLGTIMSSFAETLAGPLNSALAPVVELLQILGEMMGATLVPFIESFATALAPLIEAFAWLYNKVLRPINYAGQIMAGLFWNFGVLLRNILTFNWANLGRGMIDIGSIRMADEIDPSGVLSGAGAADAGDRAAGATFQQQRPIEVTVNVYDNDVYGGNLQDFAVLIRREFESLDELGL